MNCSKAVKLLWFAALIFTRISNDFLLLYDQLLINGEMWNWKRYPILLDLSNAIFFDTKDPPSHITHTHAHPPPPQNLPKPNINPFGNKPSNLFHWTLLRHLFPFLKKTRIFTGTANLLLLVPVNTSNPSPTRTFYFIIVKIVQRVASTEPSTHFWLATSISTPHR